MLGDGSPTTAAYAEKRSPQMNLTKANKLVRERDNNICQLCGRWAADVHHIVPAGMGCKRTNELYNMISLCRECHDKLHRNRELREKCQDWSRKHYGSALDNLIAKKRGRHE